MSLPHDYYDPHHPPEDDRPDLHNKHESWPYLDPDYWANWHDDQLPLISTVGRGPRGEGLTVGSSVDEDGNVSFTLVSTLTGETVWESPNLAPADITFSGDATDWKKLVPGVHAPLDITVSRGGTSKTTTVYLPAGQRGSLVFLLNDVVERSGDDTYSTTIDKLTVYGRAIYQDKPIPRPNDVIFFHYTKGTEYGIGFGTIEDVGGYKRKDEGTPLIPVANQVIYTARVFVPTSGVPARITEFEYIELPKGSESYANLTQLDVNLNTYKMELGLPKVEDGKNLVIVNDMASILTPTQFMEDVFPNYGDYDVNSAFIVGDMESGQYMLVIRGEVQDPETAPGDDPDSHNPWYVVPYGLADTIDVWDALYYHVLTDTELGDEDSEDSTDMFHTVIPSESQLVS